MIAVDPSEEMIMSSGLFDESGVTAMLGNGESIPLPDDSVDMVISFLSFRYMEWRASLNEMKRVVREKGRVVIIDMLARPLTVSRLTLFLVTLCRTQLLHVGNPRFATALRALHRNEEWQQMVRDNPARDLNLARTVISEYFRIDEEQFLSQSLKACTVGFVCCS